MVLIRALTWVGFWTVSIARDLRGLLAPRQRKAQPIQDLNLEPTNLCNANCVFCGYQFQGRAYQQMDLKLAAALVESAGKAGVHTLGLTPIVDEPLVHRNLEEIIRLASQPPYSMRVGLTTNAILLTPERYKSLCAAGLKDVSISMSFPDEEEYKRIYRSNGLKTVLQNLNQILDEYQKGGCEITLSLRTPRLKGWRNHPLLNRAIEKGWRVNRNRLFDDWSGKTAEEMQREGLLRRPNRPKILPCTMTYAGPHFLSDGRATACGCRDLDGKSDLALNPVELQADMKAVYATGKVAQLREKFRNGAAPEICKSCRHYNPTYEGEKLGIRLRQLGADMLAGVGLGPKR